VVAVTAAGGTITMLVGAVVLRLSLTDTYERYVRPEMGLWLVIAGFAVIALGLITLVQSIRGVKPAEGHGHDDEHAHGVGVGWLLLAPIAALLLVAPPTLGSYGVGRAGAVNVKSGAAIFEPLPRGGPPRPMTLLEYVERSFEHQGASLRAAPVQLTGFVAAPESGGFELARYQIACCAADATPVVIEVVGISGSPPKADQWVTVTGTFEPGGGELPRIRATTVEGIEAPNDPYE
jgi:uncharacterized repeat protein (TIGR03943 family)